MGEEKRFSKNWMLRIASVLLYLVLVTTWMISALLAKYVSTGMGEDGARIAEFDITSELNQFNEKISVELKPGESMDYRIVVRNRSEVKVVIEPTVTSVGTLPLTMRMYNLHGSNDVVWSTQTTPEIVILKEKPADESAYSATVMVDEYNYLNLELSPGAERAYEIKVDWEKDAENTDNKSFRYAGNVNSLQLTIKVVQVD